MEEGHYAVSGIHNEKIGVVFNYHPKTPGEQGLNFRTNLYYVETKDFGETWHTVKGESLTIPLTNPASPALVKNYKNEKLLAYIHDLNFDKKGNPIILTISSRGFQPGPANNPRNWEVFAYKNGKWNNSIITNSDNNYDVGSVYFESAKKIRVIGPTERGPQQYNPGGEVAVWESKDGGSNWKRINLLTQNSPRNHNYVRRPHMAKPGFYGFWADGHGRKPSESQLYFTTKAGEVYILPREFIKPETSPIKY